MFQAYFEVFYSLFVWVTIKDPTLSSYGYQLFPPATSYLAGDYRKFDISDIFWGVLFIVCRGELVTIEDRLLSAHGYQS